MSRSRIAKAKQEAQAQRPYLYINENNKSREKCEQAALRFWQRKLTQHPEWVLSEKNSALDLTYKLYEFVNRAEGFLPFAESGVMGKSEKISVFFPEDQDQTLDYFSKLHQSLWITPHNFKNEDGDNLLICAARRLSDVVNELIVKLDSFKNLQSMQKKLANYIANIKKQLDIFTAIDKAFPDLRHGKNYDEKSALRVLVDAVFNQLFVEIKADDNSYDGYAKWQKRKLFEMLLNDTTIADILHKKPGKDCLHAAIKALKDKFNEEDYRFYKTHYDNLLDRNASKVEKTESTADQVAPVENPIKVGLFLPGDFSDEEDVSASSKNVASNRSAFFTQKETRVDSPMPHLPMQELS